MAGKEIICIKCKAKMSPQDSRGWERIVDNSPCFNNPEGSANIFFICPKCILDFQAVKDERNRLEQEIQRYHAFFKTLNELLEETKGI